ncbi:MAG: YihA family ribosome biogenesis GTP-binding protein [Paludibacteraceae bacterium]|nr:YihA family ribosome biogenesis GTP-binding protein [Paludibacteraceae bacterium]
MDIKSAEFIISNSEVYKCPKHNLPEYAFIGRSNVGKSSLINMLTERKDLAKTSSKPGKTLLINHFLINKNWFLVDLPGYGYAKVSKSELTKLDKIIKGYVMNRESLTNLFVLVDARLEPQKIDLEFIEFLGVNGIPFAIIFTKADKLSAGKLHANITAYRDKLYEQWEELPPIFVSSAETKMGREDILNYIESINAQMAESSENK